MLQEDRIAETGRERLTIHCIRKAKGFPWKVIEDTSSGPPASRWPCPGSTHSCLAHSLAKPPSRPAHGLHLHAAGLAPGLLLSRRRRARTTNSTPYLEVLKDFRSDFTVVSGLSHARHEPRLRPSGVGQLPDRRAGRGPAGFSQRDLARPVRGRAHRRPDALPQPGPVGRRRRPVLDADRRTGAGGHLAVEGVRQALPRRQARRSRRRKQTRLEDGRSILDDVRDQAKTLRSGLGADDRDQLDEYFTSVRDLEQRLAQNEAWSKKPKPKVNVEPPKDIPNVADLIGRTRLLFDLTHLALQTDSTRLITIMLGGTTYVPPIQGVTLGHHDLSHHGKDPGKLAQLKIVEVETMKTLRDLLAKLKQSKEEGDTLLDRTMVFLGSNLGDGSSHSVKNLPVLLAGGGFKHGQHLPFDPQNPPPLCNLYVSMLQRLGIEADKFSTGTGTLTGLEAVG